MSNTDTGGGSGGNGSNGSNGSFNTESYDMRYGSTISDVCERSGYSILFNKFGEAMPLDIKLRGTVTLFTEAPPDTTLC